jgi:hypothetical protein
MRPNLLAVAALLSVALVACGSSSSTTSPSPDEGAPSAPLAATGGVDFKVADVIAVEGDEERESGTTHTVRIIASDRGDLCERLKRDGVLQLSKDEQLISVRVPAKSFEVKRIALGRDPGAAGVAFGAVCDGGTRQGTGSVTISSVGDVVSGVLDATVGDAALKGTFDAKRCAVPVFGTATCP